MILERLCVDGEGVNAIEEGRTVLGDRNRSRRGLKVKPLDMGGHLVKHVQVRARYLDAVGQEKGLNLK